MSNFKEHDIVTAIIDIPHVKGAIPVGTQGTIVHMHTKTDFAVEFPDPWEVVTVNEDIVIAGKVIEEDMSRLIVGTLELSLDMHKVNQNLHNAAVDFVKHMEEKDLVKNLSVQGGELMQKLLEKIYENQVVVKKANKKAGNIHKELKELMGI